MNIRPITETDWQSVVAIQVLAYRDDLQESALALRAKALISPSVCRVVDDQRGQVLAYCLSHAWPCYEAPSLHSTEHQVISEPNLFLHDLALHPSATGKGLARQLFGEVLSAAKQQGFTTMSLVAVQDSALFWQKFGFQTMDYRLPASYGAGAQFMMLTL